MSFEKIDELLNRPFQNSSLSEIFVSKAFLKELITDAD